MTLDLVDQDALIEIKMLHSDSSHYFFLIKYLGKGGV